MIGPRRGLEALAALAFLLLAGCRTVGPVAEPTPASERERYAARPVPLAESEPSEAGSETVTPPAASPAMEPQGSEPLRPRVTPTPAPRTLVKIDDPTGDAGLTAPDHADLVGVLIADDGTDARIVVDVAGELGDRTEDGEVIGVGVDLFRQRDDQESAYQVFADGEPDGWYAYLHTPSGLVRYPGTFELGRSRLVFGLSWSDLGGLRSGALRAFLDRSKEGTALNESSQDVAPDEGREPFSR